MYLVKQDIALIFLVAFPFLGDGLTKGTQVLAVERFRDPCTHPVILRIGDSHTNPGNRLQRRQRSSEYLEDRQ
jgi:hypothetical protein